MTIRTPISAEAIARAIKAQIAIDRGVGEVSLRIPLAVVAVDLDSEGCNWHLGEIAYDESIRSCVIQAAARVSHSYRLDS